MVDFKKYYLPVANDITVPRLTNIDGKKFLSYKRLSAIDRAMINTKNTAEVLQLVETSVVSFKDLFVQLFVNNWRKDEYKCVSNWKENILDKAVNDYYILYFFGSNKYVSHVRQPFVDKNGSVTLPVTLHYNQRRREVDKVVVWDINMKAHTLLRCNIRDNDPGVQWMLEHVFHTLTYESVYNHLAINHAISVYQRYECLKRMNSTQEGVYEFKYIGNNITLQSYLLPVMSGSMFRAVIPFSIETNLRDCDQLIDNNENSVATFSSFRKVKKRWSFYKNPYAKINKSFRNTFQNDFTIMSNCIHQYVDLKYARYGCRAKKHLKSFLLNSCVISSYMHYYTTSPYMASFHTGTIDESNIYAKYTTGEVIASNTATKDDYVVPLIEWLLPEDLNQLLVKLQQACHTPGVIPGLSHYIPLVFTYILNKILE